MNILTTWRCSRETCFLLPSYQVSAHPLREHALSYLGEAGEGIVGAGEGGGGGLIESSTVTVELWPASALFHGRPSMMKRNYL